MLTLHCELCLVTNGGIKSPETQLVNLNLTEVLRNFAPSVFNWILCSCRMPEITPEVLGYMLQWVSGVDDDPVNLLDSDATIRTRPVLSRCFWQVQPLRSSTCLAVMNVRM